MAASSSSSSSSVVPTRKRGWAYDVYLSFRGEDTRYSFADHLYHALTLKGIHVFKDDEILGGGQIISEELVKAIKESRWAVVVFSKHYANSSWCLEELSYIMECRDQMKVLPVFYHVDPSDIRGQKRDFAMAFKEHEGRFRGEVDKVKKWRAALTAAANLPGQHNFPGYGTDEFAFIHKIVDEIIADIQPREGIRGDHLIGIEPALYSSVVPTRKGGWAYDVFLSFCSTDTGNNFSDHLYAALVREPIRVFRHGYAGQTISENVVKAVEESRFAVVVFSKNYANSTLCLEELSTIMECRVQIGQRVLPVFYHVDQLDIHKQKGEFARAFKEHEYEYHFFEVKKWRDALTAAAILSGFHISPDNTGESAFVTKIVQETLADVERSERKIGKISFSNKEIGNGSYGTVVLDGLHGTRPAAVKRILKKHYDNVASKEIDNLIKSDGHPNIVRYYDVEYDQDFVYIALERCICSLHELVSSPTKPTVQSLQLTLKVNEHPSPELLELMRDTIAGVAHLHKIKYIHRDIKPQNVLISKDSSIRAKVSDMGISKCLPADKSSLTNATGYGTSGWLAPETLCKERQTSAVDLFGYGCLLFFCITGGRHPFGDDMPERDINIKTDCNPIHLSLLDDFPEALDLVSNLIQRNPESRPTAAEAYHHPLFWDPDTRLSFLRTVSEILEGETNSDLPSKTEEDKIESDLPSKTEENKTDSDLPSKTEENNLKAKLDSIGTVVFGSRNWKDHVHSTLLSDIKKPDKQAHKKANNKPRVIKYENSVCDLVRLIRNKFSHYKQLPSEVQAALGDVPIGFEAYFSSRFPKLLIEVYKELKPYGNQEATLKKYYETTLVKHT